MTGEGGDSTAMPFLSKGTGAGAGAGAGTGTDCSAEAQAIVPIRRRTINIPNINLFISTSHLYNRSLYYNAKSMKKFVIFGIISLNFL